MVEIDKRLPGAGSVLAAGNNISLSSTGRSATIINVLSSDSLIQDVGSANAPGLMDSKFPLVDHVHRGVGQLQISGNTSNDSTPLHGTVVVAGGSNVTLSQVGNSVTIVGAGGSVGAGNDTLGMSNLGNTLGTSGVVSGSAVQLVLAGGNNITLSQSLDAGKVSGTITIVGPNVPAQSTQPAVGSLNGSSGTLTIVAGTNITVSNTGSSISIIGPNVPSQSTQSYNILAAGTQTANTTGTVVLSNSNNITFGMGNSSVVTASASFSQSVQPAVGSLNGSSGTLTIVAGSNITVSNTGSSISIIGASQSVQPAIGGIQGSGTNIATTGTVQFSNSNNVSFGLSGQTMTASASYPAQSVQSYDIIAAGSQTAQTTGTVMFSNSNNVWFGMSNNSIVTASASYPAQSVQSYDIIAAGTQTANTSGTVVFSNSNNVSFGMTNNSIVTASASYPAQTVQSYDIIAAGTQTANTSGTVVFSNSNNVSFGMTNNSIVTASASYPAQTVQSYDIIAVVGSTANTTGTVVFSNSNNVSFSMTNNSIVYASASYSKEPSDVIAVVGSTANTTGTVVFSNSNNVSFSMTNSSIVYASASFAQSTQPYNINAVVGSTANTTGTVVFSNSNNVSFSMTNSSIIYASASYSKEPSDVIAVVGSTANTTGTVVFSNSNNVSFGMSNSSVVTASASFNQSLQPAVAQLNGSQGTMSIVAGNMISVSNNASTISIIDLYSTSSPPTDVGSATADGTGVSRLARYDHVHRGVGQLNGSYGTLTISASTNITVSNTSGTIILSVANLSAVQQLDASSGAITLVAGNMISVSNTSGTISIINLYSTSSPPTDVGSATADGTGVSRLARYDHVHRGLLQAQISGNTSNTSNIVYGSLVLAGGNNITLSQVSAAGGATITISAATGAAVSVGTGIVPVNVLNASGTTNITNNTVSAKLLAVWIPFAGSINVQYQAKVGSTAAFTFQIYQNGTSTGATTSCTASAAYTTITANVSMSAGAFMEIWHNGGPGVGQKATVQNVSIFIS